MKIALIGYGKMGKMIDQLATHKQHEIVARINSKGPFDDSVNRADVWIDFTRPECAVEHIQLAIEHGKPLVMGTSGWYDRLPEVEKMVENSGIGFLYTSNFSVGANLFYEIVAQAAALFHPFSTYDVALTEFHHNQKLDSPSGTARSIAQRIVEKMPRKPSVEIASVRCGKIPGTHTVYFDSAEDTITLSHEARNREGFAQGAILAAEWLKDKKGFYTLHDMLYGSAQ